MTTYRWWQRPLVAWTDPQHSTRMVRAAKLGLAGSVIWLVGWVIGFESAVWRTISIFGKMMVGVFLVAYLVAYLARLIGGKDLVNKVLGPPPHRFDDRKWWES